MNPGFAGIDNELYTADNTLMLFGDAKQVIGELAKAVSGEQGGGPLTACARQPWPAGCRLGGRG